MIQDSGLQKIRPIRGQRSQEVELWRQEIELLLNQWEISNVVVFNPNGKPSSLSDSAHWAAHAKIILLSVLVNYLKVFMCELQFQIYRVIKPNFKQKLSKL